MTMGKALFGGGIIGLVITLVMFIIVLLYLNSRRKKLRENLDKNY